MASEEPLSVLPKYLRSLDGKRPKLTAGYFINEEEPELGLPRLVEGRPLGSEMPQPQILSLGPELPHPRRLSSLGLPQLDVSLFGLKGVLPVSLLTLDYPISHDLALVNPNRRFELISEISLI